VVEAAFTGERERPYKTISVVVVYKGRIIAERYAPGFGLLYENDGIWNGERILPEGWATFTAKPAPATLLLPEEHEVYAGYGVQFWLYGRHPRLPADAYSTSGARGQHATIVPSRDVVVARMGLDPLVDSGWDQPAFVADVLSAISTDSVVAIEEQEHR
jgi:CubicO group peptidase (beta-lactamase class C family)